MGGLLIDDLRALEHVLNLEDAALEEGLLVLGLLVLAVYLGHAELLCLTDREREIVQLLAEGRSNKEVAGLLGISVKTAETHRANIMNKLDIHETAGLVRYAIRHGMVEA